MRWTCCQTLLLLLLLLCHVVVLLAMPFRGNVFVVHAAGRCSLYLAVCLSPNCWLPHCCCLLQTSTEVFFRKAKFWDGAGKDAPPAFHVDGVQYLHVKVRASCQAASSRMQPVPLHPATPACLLNPLLTSPLQVGGLYWVAVTRDNVSPSLVTELLMRLYWICRDYFGYVSEEVRELGFAAATLYSSPVSRLASLACKRGRAGSSLLISLGAGTAACCPVPCLACQSEGPPARVPAACSAPLTCIARRPAGRMAR